MKKYHILTYGCQMNKSDSERIAAVLEKANYKQSPALNKADLVVLNVCSVRQSAVDRVYAKITRLRQCYGGQRKIILTGCVLKTDKEKFSELVDYILNIKDLAKWPEILQGSDPCKSLQGSDPCKFGRCQTSLSYLKVKPQYQTFPIAYVPISFGCNNFCSYCVVPYTRGKEIHRSPTEIIKEIKSLVGKKYKQFILLGENVNSYPQFTDLLKKITALEGGFAVSFLAANPKNFTDELINEIACNPKLEKYLHLPLQSGDNEILKKMRRPYTSQEYLRLVEKIKKKIPDVKIATDIIVGFPGETKKQFQNTVNLIKNVDPFKVYIAKYSPRAGTAAFYLKDNVPTEEKKKREKVLRNLL